MVRLHGAELLRKLRQRIDLHKVLREGALDFVMNVAAYDVGQMLNEIAAPDDVEDLRAAADRKHREIAVERAIQQSELRAVAGVADAIRLGMRGRAVRLGIEIGTAGEQ